MNEIYQLRKEIAEREEEIRDLQIELREKKDDLYDLEHGTESTEAAESEDKHEHINQSFTRAL